MRGLALATMVAAGLLVVGSAHAVEPAAAPEVQQAAQGTPVETIEAAPVGEVQAVDAVDPGAEQLIESAAAETERSYTLSATLEHRQLLIVDETWANDHYLIAVIGGSADLFWGVKGFARLGLVQRFVRGSGAFNVTEMRDTELGLSYGQEARLSIGSFSRDLKLKHGFALVLPTSDTSHDRDLIMAGDLRSGATMPLAFGFAVGAGLRGQYRWHRYAELGPGPDSPLATQLVFAGSLSLEYTMPEALARGELTFALGLGRTYVKKYPGIDEDPTLHSWFPQYGWDVSASYTPSALDWLSASLSVEQGGSVLRDGIVRTYLVHRDETELGLSLTATY